jgi:hypothetical protein
MKTSANHFTTYENIALVQLRAEPETTFPFGAGAPEMQNGGLIITEATEGGVVGRLLAVNATDSFLLLTDADVLIGAKQNRIINKSMLLAPNSKTLIDVSCIERLRWNYTSGNFSSPGSSADHDLRKAKASSMSARKNEATEMRGNTQGTVWSHINNRMMDENFSERTESYHEYAKHHYNLEKAKFPECNPAHGCNGIAVVADSKVQCIDIFGNAEAYSYYFRMVRDSAFRTARREKQTKAIDMHEAYFKVVDALDSLEAAERKEDKQYAGAGLFTQAEMEHLISFELTMEGQMIHQAVFMK